MNPTVATLFVLCAGALWLLSRPNRPAGERWFARHRVAGAQHWAGAPGGSHGVVDRYGRRMLFGNAMHATPDGRQNKHGAEYGRQFHLDGHRIPRDVQAYVAHGGDRRKRWLDWCCCRASLLLPPTSSRAGGSNQSAPSTAWLVRRRSPLALAVGAFALEDRAACWRSS